MIRDPAALSVPRRVFYGLCGVLFALALSVAGLSWAVFVQNDDIKTGVASSCSNSRALIELITELPANEETADAIASLKRAARSCD